MTMQAQQIAIVKLSAEQPKRIGKWRPHNKSISDDAVIAAYRETENVWLAGERIGLSGQSVSRRLKKCGVPVTKRWFTERERDIIRAYYSSTPVDTFDLQFLHVLLQRSKPTICKEARSLGLSDPSRKCNAAQRRFISGMVRESLRRNGHPKGMSGKRHTDETKAIVGAASKLMWATHKTFGIGLMSEESRDKRSLAASKRMSKQSGANTYSRCAGGYRADLPGPYFRSSWEANYARYLNLLQKMGVVESWEYEPETYWFGGVKRGVMSYKPDFRVKYRNDPIPVTVEVKGWVTPKDRTKWRRMAKYHPSVKLEIVAEKQYRAIAQKWASAIPNWERGVRGYV